MGVLLCCQHQASSATAEARTVLMQDPYLQNALQNFDKVTLALVGIGTVEPSRVLADSGTPSRVMNSLYYARQTQSGTSVYNFLMRWQFR